MEQESLIIHGVTEEGKKLRPGDWIERVCSSVTAFGDQRCMTISKSVQACVIEGEKCLVVARNMELKDPAAYKFVMDFASSNRLKVVVDRRQGDRALAVAISN